MKEKHEVLSSGSSNIWIVIFVESLMKPGEVPGKKHVLQESTADSCIRISEECLEEIEIPGLGQISCGPSSLTRVRGAELTFARGTKVSANWGAKVNLHSQRVEALFRAARIVHVIARAFGAGVGVGFQDKVFATKRLYAE